MKIAIAAVGRARAKPEAALYHEYIKRLPWKVKLIELEAGKKVSEAKLLLEATKKADLRIALDERGKLLSTEAFARQIKRWQDESRGSIAFILGGADGLDDSVRQACALTLSLSPMTWPHLLARAMLAEQLYRVHTILSGHPYHRV